MPNNLRAVILHGTSGSSKSNWLPSISEYLVEQGREVWVPNLPNADYPDIDTYNTFLLQERPWEFNDKTLLIGHSSGAVAILNLLQQLSTSETVGHAVLVSSFSSELSDDPDWAQLKGLFKIPFDFKLIKSKATQFTFVHAQNDPYCPVAQPVEQAAAVNGNLILLPDGGHFSTDDDPKWTQFPVLIDILESKL